MINRFECKGKVYAVAMMKMVFLNDQYRTISGKEALSVVIPFLYNL